MNMMKPILCTLLISTLGACASVNSSEPIAGEGKKDAEVLFFRQSSLQAKLADAYLGTGGGDYFLQLGEKEYARYPVTSGWYEFVVKAHGSVSSSQNIEFHAGKTTCVEVRPNTEDVEWLAVPFLNALIPSFKLESVPCVSLAELTQVE
ncbi:MAG: hypothetical protein CMI01_15790 [Oceanospirillaceae bacterium]|nr:hypothetical protein [Oceanospirillaceae bacterium]